MHRRAKQYVRRKRSERLPLPVYSVALSPSANAPPAAKATGPVAAQNAFAAHASACSPSKVTLYRAATAPSKVNRSWLSFQGMTPPFRLDAIVTGFSRRGRGLKPIFRCASARLKPCPDTISSQRLSFVLEARRAMGTPLRSQLRKPAGAPCASVAAYAVACRRRAAHRLKGGRVPRNAVARTVQKESMAFLRRSRSDDKRSNDRAHASRSFDRASPSMLPNVAAAAIAPALAQAPLE